MSSDINNEDPILKTECPDAESTEGELNDVQSNNINEFEETSVKMEHEEKVELTEEDSKDIIDIKPELDSDPEFEIDPSDIKLEDSAVFPFEFLQCEYTEPKKKRGKKVSHKKTKSAVNVDNTYPCDKCEYVASRKDKLNMHYKSVHLGIKYPCTECDYVASRPDKLKVGGIYIFHSWSKRVNMGRSLIKKKRSEKGSF